MILLHFEGSELRYAQIFLETPRARVTLLLSKYHEQLAGSPSAKTPKESLQTASDLLSDLQVETYSSMERKEKTEFILEQMRLLIAVAKIKDEAAAKDGKDSLSDGDPEWTKVRVGSRKINEDFLKDPENQVCSLPHCEITRALNPAQESKLRYYDMLVEHALHSSSYLDVAKYYHKIWETPSVKEDESGKGRVVCSRSTIPSDIVNMRHPGFGAHSILHRSCPTR